MTGKLTTIAVITEKNIWDRDAENEEYNRLSAEIGEVKSCPFCGKQGWARPEICEHSAWVICDACNCTGPTFTGPASMKNSIRSLNAILLWNSRK